MGKHSILKEQKRLLYTVFAITMIACLAVLYFVVDTGQTPSHTKQENKIDLPTDSMNPQENWNIQTGDSLSILHQKMGFVETIILEHKEKEEESKREKLALVQKLSELEQRLAEKDQEMLEVKGTLSKKTSKTQGHFPFSEGEENLPLSGVPRRGLIVLKADFSKDKVKHVDECIPAGTTVKAVMVSSVDAPCGAFSNADPQPIKLRIVDDGHLPNSVRARLKGGIIIASAYGDLSSERIYVRIERLTQVKPSGDFIETTVTGFVTGEDGKYGVRGCVVDRSATLVQNAAVSGVFSGASNFFQAYAATVWNPWGWGGAPCGTGNTNFQCSTKDLAYGMAAQGGAEGANNAFDTLTDYYIRRAELLKPVIQVNAGRTVDITFTVGTEVGDIHAAEHCEKIRARSREVRCAGN